MTTSPTTIQAAIDEYLEDIHRSKSKHTHMAYEQALRSFSTCLDAGGIRSTTPLPELTIEAVYSFMDYMEDKSVATENLFLSAVLGFYEYLYEMEYCDFNIIRIRAYVRKHKRKQGQRLPQFPREAIERMIVYAETLKTAAAADPAMHLRSLRDRALIITLAETGLRIHEACKMLRGEVDWNERVAVIIGKGDKQDVVHISEHAVLVIRDYLHARAELDGSTGKPLASLPIFSGHHPRKKVIKAISPKTGWAIVVEHARIALPPEEAENISPHSFRHYFVTVVLRGSGNLKLAQELARHKNIRTTERYAHLSDEDRARGYDGIFQNTIPEPTISTLKEKSYEQ